MLSWPIVNGDTDGLSMETSLSPATCCAEALMLYRKWKYQSEIELHFVCVKTGIDCTGLDEQRDFLNELCNTFDVYKYTVDKNALSANLVNRRQRGLASSLVFLDVDGVLNLPVILKPLRLNAACGARFVELVRGIGDASVVLSSSWRAKPLLVLELTDFLVTHGADNDILVGLTPDNGGRLTTSRGSEVQDWLMANQSHQQVPYIMIDDLPFSPHHGRGIWTDAYVGLMDIDVERAIFKVQYQKVKGPAADIPSQLV